MTPIPGNVDVLEDIAARVEAAYLAATPASGEWYERASRSLAGGVSGPVRWFWPRPMSFVEGSGSHATDLDGRSYIDSFLCGASLMLGHRAPQIMDAIAATASTGSIVFNPPNVTELAEELQAAVPAAERVRLLNSGTEAILSALRFARAFTGRTRIVKFHGTYHGQDDQVLVGLDGRAKRLGAGIPATAVAETITLRLGDLDAIADALASGEVAAVLLDPSMHHGGYWAASSDHYAAIRRLCQETGTLLIFDEVISGFRLALGGAQEVFGVVPDLAVYGKAFGAGERIGAVVGRADIMAVADPTAHRAPFAFQSGTGNDARNSVAAALAAIRSYRELGAAGGYTDLDARAARLADGLHNQFTARGLPCLTRQLGPMVRVFITDGPDEFEHCDALDPRPVNLFHLGLVTERVFTLPGSNDFVLSFAHTDADIDSIVDAAGRALDRFGFERLGDSAR